MAETTTQDGKWYIVHAYSGFEKKVAQAIKDQAIRKGMGDLIQEALVPTEEVVEMRRGQRVSSERKFLPGYVLVRMVMTDETWHLVKNTAKVTGFLGTGSKPSPIRQSEADRILRQVQEGIERPKPSILFEIGEMVRVSDGPFASFNGMVEDIDEDKARLKVAVTIFGRSTPVELEYSQVEKL
ncbi:MAG: transcription termination/antitermination protein NusG [Alphaproteobacteria bacterium]|nr:transcription termination/antitermination protein NusG [Alphaproteobacteria bacterium]MDP7174440.1 transcription termination/antitermination protein NusG [Alphaproteobacteria bacterium]